MNARASIRGFLVVVAAVALAGQIGCSKDGDEDKTGKDKGSATNTSEATSDSKLLALKFHHDK